MNTLAAKYNKDHKNDRMIGSTAEARNVFISLLHKNGMEISLYKILNVSSTVRNIILTCAFYDKSNQDFKELVDLKTGDMSITYFHTYIKFDRRPWFNAGRVTGKFDGAGVSFNSVGYAKFNQLVLESHKQGFLLYALPNYFYIVDFDKAQNSAISTVQDWNNENVVVVPIKLFTRLEF